MKSKLLPLLLCFLILFSLLTAAPATASNTYTAAQVDDLCDGIVAFKMAQSGSSSVQDFIDTALCDSAGSTAEYYVITLSQSGSYNFSRYEKALLDHIGSHETYSATTREKYALALLACGSDSPYISEVCDDSIGGLGLMSLVFGLHLLNNGCTSARYTADSLISAILSAQLSDGGWAVIGSSGDVDVTAMTLQALAPYYGADGAVTRAVDSALSLLSSLQLDSAGFRSMGAENCESSAQVLTALSSLGIDQSSDTRFIKGGRTVLDSLLSYRNSDGSFAHTGSAYNENATIQAFYSLRSYTRMLRGQSPFYILDSLRAPAHEPTDAPAKPTQARGDSSSSPGGAYSAPSPGSQGSSPAGTSAASAPPTAAAQSPTQAAASETIRPTGTARFQPAAGGSEAPSAASVDEATAERRGSYKLYAALTIAAAAVIISLILFILKKRNIKNYIAVAVLAALAILFILLTNFESIESYRTVDEKTDSSGTVTLSISCGTVRSELSERHNLPSDGVILADTEFTITEGSTVYDVLLEASKTRGIQIDNQGAEGAAYIAGINYLYEYEYGELSGWMYRVNGEFPEVGCQGYTLSDGDRIEWLYTRNIGKDL